ncbi:MAG TPA: hypothetical protein VLG27_04255 [Candidatus Saccharimonadia bacterium]|nr:hypothetical protein [Candidatus Saccharimonadia bacterium]
MGSSDHDNSHYAGALLEEIDSKIDMVLEGQADLAGVPVRLQNIEGHLENVEDEIKAIKAAIKDQGRELKEHGRRLGSIDSRVGKLEVSRI